MKKLLNSLTALTTIGSFSSFVIACEKDKKIGKPNIGSKKEERESKKEERESKKEDHEKAALDNNQLEKIKEYIEKDLHPYSGISSFDAYPYTSERQFFADQSYNDVVNFVNNKVALFCKQKDFKTIKFELDEENELLKQYSNVINIKLSSNNQVLKSKIRLENVKEARDNNPLFSDPIDTTLKKIKDGMDWEFRFGNHPNFTFFTYQNYNDVVEAINKKYIELYCKKENLNLVKATLNEENKQLDENENVIKLKLELNNKSVDCTIRITNVKSINVLASRIVNQTFNFTYKELTEENTFLDVVNKLKNIYQTELSANRLNSISFNEGNTSNFLASDKLKWGENIIPIKVWYDQNSSNINTKINLISSAKFPKYETERVVNEVILKNTNDILNYASLSHYYDQSKDFYWYIATKINYYLKETTDTKVTVTPITEIVPQPRENTGRAKPFPSKATFKASLGRYEKIFEIAVNESNNYFSLNY